MQINEENFVEELKKQNEEALDYLVDHYGWVVKTVLKKHLFYLMDHYDECMNDCFLAVWQGIDSYDPKKSSFTNWLGGLARFKAIDYMRKYLKDRQVENIEAHSITDKKDLLSQILQRELRFEIQEILASLSDRDQEIFHKVYIEDKSVEEVSKELKTSKPAIYNRISRARKFLRKKRTIKEGKNERF